MMRSRGTEAAHLSTSTRMRSKLFVPASRPELFEKALNGAADALSFDLEDAVAETRKAEARRALGRFLQSLPAAPGKTIVVRVNGRHTPHFRADLEAIVGPAVDLINLPKATSAEDVRACVAALAEVEQARGLEPMAILPNIEDPRALGLAAEIAGASPRVVGLQAGWSDLVASLGMDRYDATAIGHLQLQIRVAAGAAGVWAYDGAWANIKDPDGYRREAEAARRLGYLGKTAIHPTQVPIANDVFRPSEAEIGHALGVVEAARDAAEAGVGAFTVAGRMVDAPIVRRAKTVLALARELGLAAGEPKVVSDYRR